MFTRIKEKPFTELTDVELDYLYNEHTTSEGSIKGMSMSQIAYLYGVPKDKVKHTLSKYGIQKKDFTSNAVGQILVSLVKAIQMLRSLNISMDIIKPGLDIDELPEHIRLAIFAALEIEE